MFKSLFVNLPVELFMCIVLHEELDLKPGYRANTLTVYKHVDNLPICLS